MVAPGSTRTGRPSSDDHRSGPPALSRRQARRLADLATEQEWLDLPKRAGTHLRWRRVGRGTFQLVTTSGTVWAELAGKTAYVPTHVGPLGPSLRYTVTSRGRTYELRGVGRRGEHTRELVDVLTGTAVLRITGFHFDRKAGTRVSNGHDLSLEFPAKGSYERALMVATDGSGAILIRYRYNPGGRSSTFGVGSAITGVEVVVDRSVVSFPELPLVIAATSGCVNSYFGSSGGGG